MVFQEVGNNNIVCGLDDNSSTVIDICGSNNKIIIYENSNIQNLTIRIIGNNNNIILRENIKIKEQLFIYADDSSTYLEIGKNTTFENTCISMTDVHNKVIIGEDCMFAAGTKILSGDFHSIIDLNTKKRINYGYEIIIKNHVWVGLDAKILKNVKIEEDSVIAAGSLVTKDISAGCIAGGVPAKILKTDITWLRERAVEGEGLVKQEFLEGGGKKDSELLTYNLEEYNQIIKGWIFLKEQESAVSKLYAELTYENNRKEQKIVPLTARKDVSDFYNDIRYLFSGFIFFKKEDKPLREIKFIIENSGFIGSRTIYLNDLPDD